MPTCALGSLRIQSIVLKIDHFQSFVANPQPEIQQCHVAAVVVVMNEIEVVWYEEQLVMSLVGMQDGLS